MKNLKQITGVLGMLLISAAVIGLIAWRFAAPVLAPESSQAVLPQPDKVGAVQTSAAQNGAVVATAPVSSVVAPVTEPVAAAVAESGKDLHEDEQMEPPSQETIDAIREIKKPTPDEGQVIQNPDGSMKMKLGNRLQSVPIATIGKDGKVHVDYHGEKYSQDNQAVENSKPEEQKQEAPTP